MGRLVLTHSTYLQGLIPILQKLIQDENVKTITPGVINKAKGRCQVLKLKVSTRLMGGFKLVARKGSGVQEVFVITTLNKEGLVNKIASLLT